MSQNDPKICEIEGCNRKAVIVFRTPDEPFYCLTHLDQYRRTHRRVRPKVRRERKPRVPPKKRGVSSDVPNRCAVIGCTEFVFKPNSLSTRGLYCESHYNWLMERKRNRKIDMRFLVSDGTENKQPAPEFPALPKCVYPNCTKTVMRPFKRILPGQYCFEHLVEIKKERAEAAIERQRAYQREYGRKRRGGSTRPPKPPPRMCQYPDCTLPVFNQRAKQLKGQYCLEHYNEMYQKQKEARKVQLREKKRIYARAYYHEHQAQIRANARRNYAEHRDKFLEYGRTWRANHAKELAERSRKNYAKRKLAQQKTERTPAALERKRERDREYARRHSEQRKAYNKEYYRRKKEQKNEDVE